MTIELDPLAGPEGGEEGRRLASFWMKQIDKIKDDPKYRRWAKRAAHIEKRYRDERNRVDEDGNRRYNVLWTNVEILTPALYGQCPLPIAQRKFNDKDPVGRGAAQILERALRNEIEICGFDEALQQAVQDYLLPGRGTVWVRYEPEVEEGVSINQGGNLDIEDSQGDIEYPESDEEALEGEEGGSDQEIITPEETKLMNTGDRITRESTPVDYVHWDDLFLIPANARIWKEVTAIARRVYMTHGRMKPRFGAEIAKQVPLRKDNRVTYRYEGPDQDPDDKGEVFEIWSLTDKSVFWVASGYEFLCDKKDDPLKLECFFPCPRPMFANATTGSLVPVPDYIQYQDQAIQLDELTQRISMLAKACKVAGVYNSAAKDIQRLLDESVENELIPVDDWAAFSEKGGVAGNISLLPLKEIIGVINELQMIKEKTVLELDRLTGINDIMRGTTDARETLGGQRLKTNNTGTRLQRRQNEVARFARDTVRIMADIMSQHFSPVSLIEASGALYAAGLGDTDMPTLTSMQQGPMGMPPMPQIAPPQAPFSGPQQAQGPAGIPVPPGPMAGPASMPPGGNVVPFPGGAPSQGLMGMPPGPMGMQPPALPPEMQNKLKSIQRIAESIDLLRNERLRGFRVDIEVDSTTFGDSEAEKAQRIQFVQMVTQYLQQSLMLAGQVPEIAPLLGKFLQFAVRGFHIGRELESAIEEFCEHAVTVAKQKAEQAAKQPNPQLISAQAEMVKAQASTEANKSKDQRENVKLGMDSEDKKREAMTELANHQADVERQHVENQGEQANQQYDMVMKNMDISMKSMDKQIAELKVQVELMKAQTAEKKQTADMLALTEPESSAQ